LVESPSGRKKSLKIKEEQQMMSENIKLLKCDYCNNEWETKSDKRFVTCTSCLRKVEVIKDKTEIIIDQVIQNSSNKFLKCDHCKHEWETKSDSLFVSCPSCLRKVEIIKDKTEIINDLEKLANPNRKSRNPDLVKKIKIKHDYTCLICEQATFEDKNGNNYVESHHVIPIEKNGPDSPKNILIVCPTCHEVFRYGSESVKIDVYRKIREKKLFSDFKTLKELGVITSEMHEKIMEE